VVKDDKLLRAKVRAKAFQGEIEGRVKRLDPLSLALTLSMIGQEVVAKPDRMAMFPLHHLMHALEACCAYHRKAYSEEVTRDSLRKLVNTYHNYDDPLSEYLLRESNRLDLLCYVRQAAVLPSRWTRPV